MMMGLPYGVFRRGAENTIGVAMGEQHSRSARGVAAGLFDALPPGLGVACLRRDAETL